MQQDRRCNKLDHCRGKVKTIVSCLSLQACHTLSGQQRQRQSCWACNVRHCQQAGLSKVPCAIFKMAPPQAVAGHPRAAAGQGVQCRQVQHLL